MSIWTRLLDSFSALSPRSLIEFFTGATPPEATQGFAMAVVALGAKMAKADGRVTREEVVAFREIFQIDEADLEAVGRFFDLARRDVAGFELYAAKIARMFDSADDVLETLLDALFQIARADDHLHEAELEFLHIVSNTFGFDERAFEAMCARHAMDQNRSPFTILGVLETASPEEIKGAWKALARRYHPDQLRARGVPDEAARLAEQRMAEINAAYDALRPKVSIRPEPA
jgi:DnaJ like chaperone protein